jgi:hypothetical protein
MRFRRLKVETMTITTEGTEEEYAKFCGVARTDFSCGTLRLTTRNGRLQGFVSDIIIKVDQTIFIVSKETAALLLSRR